MDLMPWESLAKNTVGKVVDKLVSYLPLSDEQKSAMLIQARTLDLEEEKLEMSQVMQQLAINLKEAESEQWWKAGWRPAFGWTCAAAFAYKFVIGPFFVFIVLCINPEWTGFSKLPQLDWTELAAVALPLLGISSHRLSEKKAILSAKS